MPQPVNNGDTGASCSFLKELVSLSVIEPRACALGQDETQKNSKADQEIGRMGEAMFHGTGHVSEAALREG